MPQFTKLAGVEIYLRKDDIVLSCNMIEYDSKSKTGKVVIEPTWQQFTNVLDNWFLEMHALPSATLKISNITFLNDLVPERQISFIYETLNPWY